MKNFSSVFFELGVNELAQIVGVSQPAVSGWVRRGVIPPARCALVERATSGRVMRWDLRPADWHLIWPELIDRPDAPPLPSPIPPIPAPRVPRKRGRPRTWGVALDAPAAQTGGRGDIQTGGDIDCENNPL